MDKLGKILLIRMAITFIGIVLIGVLIAGSMHPVDMAAYDPTQTSESAGNP